MWQIERLSISLNHSQLPIPLQIQCRIQIIYRVGAVLLKKIVYAPSFERMGYKR